MKKVAILLCFLTFPKVSLAEKLNILTWWGYLQPQDTIAIKNRCNVDVSYDEYVSNDEFLRRFDAHKDQYQLLIFSSSLLPLLKEKLSLKHSAHYVSSLDYSVEVKKYLNTIALPNGAKPFAFSFMGFLYDSDKIKIDGSDSLEGLFKKVGTDLAILIDDYPEFLNLLQVGGVKDVFRLTPKQLSERLKGIKARSRLTITNTVDNIVKNSSFSFGFMWSGDAVMQMKRNPKRNLKFFTHPKLSYVLSDLSLKLNRTAKVDCVQRYLSSEKYLNLLEDRVYYFSPYFGYQGVAVSDVNYRRLKNDFQKNFSSFSWPGEIDKTILRRITTDWLQIKLELEK